MNCICVTPGPLARPGPFHDLLMKWCGMYPNVSGLLSDYNNCGPSQGRDVAGRGDGEINEKTKNISNDSNILLLISLTNVIR